MENNMDIRTEAINMKRSAPMLAASPLEARNHALELIAVSLLENKERIFKENARDMEAAKKKGIADAIQRRLKYDEGKLEDSVKGLRDLQKLPDPIGKVLLKRELDEGLILTKVSVPIGVIGIIFEARPDAMVQVASLCIKSGNCAILKGGKETANTNRVLFGIIKDCVIEAGLPAESLVQAELHNEIDELLSCDGEVDLLIPRGSNSFVRYIMEHTKIPVMGHSSGICHIYVDKEADRRKAMSIILDAKKQYAAACNAVETILIDREMAPEFVPELGRMFLHEGVKMNGTEEVRELLNLKGAAFGLMQESDFDTEYNDFEISLKVVEGVEEAVRHINHYGSHHTDTILTDDDETAAFFEQMVDSAGVYRNCSTRFADGFRYGFGAEVGISTGKLHARGPVGLDGLVTYKYLLKGDGHIVGDYAAGRRQFHHVDLEF